MTNSNIVFSLSGVTVGCMMCYVVPGGKFLAGLQLIEFICCFKYCSIVLSIVNIIFDINAWSVAFIISDTLCSMIALICSSNVFSIFVSSSLIRCWSLFLIASVVVSVLCCLLLLWVFAFFVLLGLGTGYSAT